jgi:multimeric flavodoxin WrbA
MDKKVLILDGRIGDDATADKSLQFAKEWLASAQWEVTDLRLSELEIAPCIGCFGCWIKTPGICVIDDAGRDVAKAIVQSDLVVYLTPILFGGYSYELKKAIDRSIPIISPMFRTVHGEVHHKKRYARYPRVLALGWMEKLTVDAEDLFQSVVKRNAINMHVPKALSDVFESREDPETMKQRIEWALSKVIGS